MRSDFSLNNSSLTEWHAVHGHGCPGESWPASEKVVDLASDARVFSYRRRKKRPLFGVQTLVGLESEERNERHDQALQDQAPNTVQSDHGGGHHHRCSEGQSHPGHR